MKEKRTENSMRKRMKPLEGLKRAWYYPHTRVVIAIVPLAAGAFILSWKFDNWGNDVGSSIFSGIFSGFITGVIICLISGRKQRFVADVEEQLDFLQELRSRILTYQMLYAELRQKQFLQYDGDEELNQFIYNVGVSASDVNSLVLQGSFRGMNSITQAEYCKRMGYDARSLREVFRELHSNLKEMDANKPTKEQVLQYFEVVDDAIGLLNREIFRKEQALKNDWKQINRSHF